MVSSTSIHALIHVDTYMHTCIYLDTKIYRHIVNERYLCRKNHKAVTHVPLFPLFHLNVLPLEISEEVITMATTRSKKKGIHNIHAETHAYMHKYIVDST